MRLIQIFGVLLLIAAIKAEELECYVCTDCETGYEDLKGICRGSGSGSGDGSGDGSGSGSGSGDGSGSGSGSGDECGSGSGDGCGSGSGSGSPDETDNDSNSKDENVIKYENFNVRVSSNDGSNNMRSANRLENTDYYSVELADTNGKSSVSRIALTRFARSTRNNDALQARCVVTSYEENNKTKIKRGCSYGAGSDTQKCQLLIGEHYTETPARCSVCEKNLCNTAYRSFGSLRLQFAFITLITGVFIYV